MSITLVNAPTTAPIHLDEVKSHLRVDHTSEDDLITGLIRSAVARAESLANLSLLTRVYDYRLNSFPCRSFIRLPHAPLRTVASIQYVDTNGATQTWDAANYTVDPYVEPGRIYPAYNETWPTTRSYINAVTVRFTAGYETPFTPAHATNTITASGHPFSNGDVARLRVSGGEDRALPDGLDANTDYYIIEASGDDFKLSTTSGGSAVDFTDDGTGSFFIGRQTIPGPILDGIKLFIHYLYDHRDDVAVNATVSPMPVTSEHLIMPYRLDRFD